MSSSAANPSQKKRNNNKGSSLRKPLETPLPFTSDSFLSSYLSWCSSNELKTEWLTWLRLSFVNGLRAFAQLLPWIVSLAMVGNISTRDLAAVSLMEVLLNNVMEIFWRAISAALTTLVSQSHATSSYTVIRGWLLIACLATTGAGVLIAALCIGAEPILVFFGADESLTALGQVYAYYIIPNVFLKGITICIGTFLVSLQFVKTATLVEVISACINVAVSYLLIISVRVPGRHTVKAAAISWDISSAACLLIMIGCCAGSVWGKEFSIIKKQKPKVLDFHYSKMHDNDELGEKDENEYEEIDDSGNNHQVNDNDNGGDNDSGETINEYERRILSSDLYSSRELSEKKNLMRRAMSTADLGDDGSAQAVWQFTKNPVRWRAFAHLGIPNLLMTFCEMISIIIMSMLAIGFGSTALAVHNTTIAIYETAFTVVYGMYEITTIRVGFYTGQGDEVAAKRVIFVSVVSSFVWGIAVAATGYFFRSQIARLLSTDDEFIELFESLSPLVWGSYAVFAIGSQFLAVLEGQGRAREQSIAFFIGSVGIAVPLYFASYYLTDLDLFGLWGALIMGYLTTMVVAGVMLTQSDWDQILDEQKKMVNGH